MINGGMHAGQREKEHLGSPNASKHHNGIDPNGHDIHPAVCWVGSRHQQHLHRQKATRWLCIRSSRGVHGGSQVRHNPMYLPLLLFLPHLVDQVHKPSQHPHQHSPRPHLHCHPSLPVRLARKRVPLEHCGQQALLRCASSPAMDLWPSARLCWLHHHRHFALQPWLRVWV